MPDATRTNAADAPDPQLVPGRLPLPLDWSEIFGRRAPLAVEIGSGGGRFIIGEAERKPDWNFVGIEPSGEYFYVMKERVAKRSLANLKLVRTDAVDLIASVFPDACVDHYHLYFPDPWPKKRHRKRRVIRPEFVAHVRRTLKPDGALYYATDHFDALEDALPVLREGLRVEEQSGPWPDAPEGRTNFEIKYIRQGRPIYRFVCRP
ncbi:MAG: tRNA (guanosine(46)-N7)-methyltransferase TrmB [Planctomycetota bacterium]|nr:tRNA (guanosine(46)-N7)-methyltransferase TrmB [Planctomycetota bacterium]